MIAIETEGTQIHFLSDVLVAVASLDLKVPISKILHPAKPIMDPPFSVVLFFSLDSLALSKRVGNLRPFF